MMFSAAIKPKVHGSLRSPLQVAISYCSPLWLKTCHRQVFLTRRAHLECHKNRVEIRDFFILMHFHNNLINIKGELLSIVSRRMTTIFFYGFHILFKFGFKFIVIYYHSVPIAVRENLSAKNTCLDIFYRGLLLVSRLCHIFMDSF